MRLYLRISTIALLSLLTGAAIAQEEKVRQQAEYAVVVQTAASLVSYGEAKGDALALLAAAKMIAALPVGLEPVDGRANVLDIDVVVGKAVALASENPIVVGIAGEIRSLAAVDERLPLICDWFEECGYFYGYYECRPYIICN
ncbi:MAG: hypothetical protein AB7I79_17935 [Rhizobiaceae bacterium]